MLKSSESILRVGVEKQRNILLLVCLGLLFANIFLATALLSHDDKIIVVPAGFNKSFYVRGSYVSSEYLEEMGEFVAHLILNISPENADYKYEKLLKYVDTRSYDYFKEHYLDLITKFKQEDISTYFSPKTMEVDENNLRVVLEGDYIQSAGSEQVSRSLEKFYIQFIVAPGGKILISEFGDYERK